MRLLLVRHGHTDGNTNRDDAPLSGTFDVPLSAKGREEARRIAERIAADATRSEFCCRGVPVYASPLGRARATAQAIGDRIGSPVAVHEGLGEIHCGDVEGLPLREVKQRYRDAWERNLRQDDPAFRWPGGESYAEFRVRAVAAATDIAERHPVTGAVIVTHAGVIAQLIGSIDGTSPACWEKHRPENCSITELWWGEPRRVLRFDDRDHL